jgi:hypothetical protein
VADLERAWHPASPDSRGLRLAHSLIQGMTELNALFPNRPQGAQEGTIGDAAHRAEGTGSDHNPNAAGVVRAWDIDCTAGVPFNPALLANYLAAMMRTQNRYNFFGSVGYVIYNWRITAWTPWGAWVPYDGSDPHIKHIHVSVGANPAEYDDTEPWNLAAVFGEKPTSTPATPITPKPAPVPASVTGEDDMTFIRFVNSGKKNNENAVYALTGNTLTWIDALTYGWLGKPPVHNMDLRSQFWKLPVTPGTPDLRGK